MLADVIREFCNEPENINYEVYENYTTSWTTPIGEETVTTIGIVAKEGGNALELIAALARYMDSKGFTDPLMELMGTNIDYSGPDAIVYFPGVQDYHPLV